MKPNEQQQRAIDASSKENILINAGAGSGKTATLSNRVFRLISSGEVAPSSLLILTFTNKAAYEMKQRIISLFAERAPESIYAKQILSAHIQTFDSFSQYLVKKYASKLGISSAFSVANESVIEAKKQEILNNILLDRYQNEGSAIFDTIKKFDTKGDSSFREILLCLDEQLNQMVPSKRREFIEHYEENYLSDEFLKRTRDQWIMTIKNEMRSCIYEAYILKCSIYKKNIFELIAEIKQQLPQLENIRSSVHFDSEKINMLLQQYLELLELDGDEFTEAFYEIWKENKIAHLRLSKEDAKEKEAFSALKKIFSTSKVSSFKIFHGCSFDKKEDKRLLLSFKEDIERMFSIIGELNKKLFDYKKNANTFTFNDIQKMALKLLTEPEFEDIAEEIRSRFTYVMVDEYQDTNDFQEMFLDSITKKGNLFCVGDPKQSIYAFRNSNVELFNRREEMFESNADGHSSVIAMNRNYRSVPQILDDINTIFLKYMTKDHGDIEYTRESQQLKYEGGPRCEHFGISRVQMINQYGNIITSSDDEPELIAQDIKRKMGDPNFLIPDQKNPGSMRRARYSDFAILIRKRYPFARYLKVFNEYGIPLSNNTESHPRDIDAIKCIESLIRYLGLIDKKDYKALPPIFISISRSYLYGKAEGFNDTEIHKIITEKKVLETSIHKEIYDFYNENKEKPFSCIFLSMLARFDFIGKLYAVGNIEDNISKIDSLYQLILSLEASGDGLHEFIQLFKNLNKYSLNLSSKTVVENEDSVQMMTIHISKGLEFEFVYMPICGNNLSDSSKPLPFIFSKEYGLLFTDADLNIDDDPNNHSSIYYKTYLHNLQSYYDNAKQIEIDEHVRLFYVALTRAKKGIIFVGNPMPRKKETLFDMLNMTDHSLMLNERIIEAVERNISDFRNLLQAYKASVEAEYSVVGARQKIGELRENDPLFRAFLRIHRQRVQSFEKQKKEYLNTLLSSFNVRFNDYLSTCDYPVILNYYLLNNFDRNDCTDLESFKKVVAEIIGELERRILSLQNPIEEEHNREDYEDSDEDYDEDEESEEEASSLTEIDPTRNPIETYGIEDAEKEIEFLRSLASLIERNSPENDMEQKEALIKLLDIHADDEYSFFRLLYAMTGIAEPLFYTYYNEFDKDGRLVFRRIEELQSLKEQKTLKIPEFHTDDTPIEFKPVIKKRASKSEVIFEDQEDEERQIERENFIQNKGAENGDSSEKAKERGIYLHKLLQLVDFSTKDTSFITECASDKHQAQFDRALVDRILSMEIFDDKEALYYPEYTYYDDEYQTHGSIDLLIQRGDSFDIIDYKTTHIDDPAYIEQLKTYRRNIACIFKIDPKKINLYLLSITKAKLKKIDE